jgi:acyl carrier protein
MSSTSDSYARVQAIFRDVFDDPGIVIRPETNSAHIDGWDSLMHINLVVAIEKDFGIRFALGELEDLKNVGEMVALIERKRG